MPAFTEKYINSLKPAGKDYERRDNGSSHSITGLLVRVAATGRKTYWVEVARSERVKIGSADAYTIKKARTRAKLELGKKAGGHDFRAERQREKASKASTLGGYLEGTFKKHAEESIASHKYMLTGLKKNFNFILSKPMGDITELDMARWYKKRSNVSLETRRRELTYLKAVLNHAVKERAIPSHQLHLYRVKGTLKDNESEAKANYLTDAEEKRLRAALDAREARMQQERRNGNKWRTERGRALMPEIGPLEYADHLKPIILIALNTGLRRGDLFGLKWEHVDLERKQIRKIINKTSHVRRKAGKKPVTAVLPLSKEAHAILRQCERQSKSEYVFPSPISGGPLNNINKAYLAIMEKAKITNFTFHDLRHTFASRLVMAGVDINTVRELMTHADIKMTLVYAHLSPDHKAAALDKAFGTVI